MSYRKHKDNLVPPKKLHHFIRAIVIDSVGKWPVELEDALVAMRLGDYEFIRTVEKEYSTTHYFKMIGETE